jgi:hypothetical protein
MPVPYKYLTKYFLVFYGEALKAGCKDEIYQSTDARRIINFIKSNEKP